MADNIAPSGSNKPGESNKASGANRPGTGGRSLDELRAKTKTTKFSSKGTKVTGEKKKESLWRSLIVALLIALVIRAVMFEAFRIPTGSMKNTLLVGDYLFVNKLAYFIRSPKYFPLTTTEIPFLSIPTGSPKRSDVIVFEYPGDQDLVVPREKKINYIKRCIGIPGDTVQIINKQVFVNGQRMVNPAGMNFRESEVRPKNEIDPHIFPQGAPWNKDWYGPIRVPKKGDVIKITTDNIHQWEVFVAREGHKVEIGNGGVIQIDGTAQSNYKVERDYLWMMGDNRDDSEDSRFWGFAPVDNVVGNALFIHWSMYWPPSSGYGDGYDPDEDQHFHIRWGRIGNIIR